MPSLSPTGATTAPTVQHFTLDNGLKVYLRVDRRTALACA